jgi:acyl-coenzyme A thioesterase PaaI-like protein
MARIPSTTAPEGAIIPERHPEAPSVNSKIPSHFAQCFGCGEKHPTGLHLVAYAREGLVIDAEFTVTENHQGAPGLAHGGLLSLAFDEALGKLMWLLRAPAVTGRLEVDFLRPVPMGSTLYITAEITGQVGRKVYTSAVGRMGSHDGPIVVQAGALYIVVPMEHFMDNAPKEYLEEVAKTPELMAFVDPNFGVNP